MAARGEADGGDGLAGLGPPEVLDGGLQVVDRVLEPEARQQAVAQHRGGDSVLRLRVESAPSPSSWEPAEASS